MTEQTNVKENGVTIDDLAIMIAKGFGAVDKRIDSLEEHMDYRFTGIQNQLDNIYLNYPNRMEYTHLSNRVKKIERKASIR